MGFRHVSVMSQVSKKKMSRVRIVTILVRQLASLPVGPGACLDSDEWVSTPPSWSDPCIGLVGPGGIFGLRKVGVHSSILIRQLAPLLVGPGACLDSDQRVSTPPSWSDPCPRLVRPGGIFGLRRVGVHSSILVRWLAPLLVRPGAYLDSDERVSTPPSWSDGLHHYQSDQGHVRTHMSRYPLLHPSLIPA